MLPHGSMVTSQRRPESINEICGARWSIRYKANVEDATTNQNDNTIILEQSMEWNKVFITVGPLDK